MSGLPKWSCVPVDGHRPHPDLRKRRIHCFVRPRQPGPPKPQWSGLDDIYRFFFGPSQILVGGHEHRTNRGSPREWMISSVGDCRRSYSTGSEEDGEGDANLGGLHLGYVWVGRSGWLIAVVAKTSDAFISSKSQACYRSWAAFLDIQGITGDKEMHPFHLVADQRSAVKLSPLKSWHMQPLLHKARKNTLQWKVVMTLLLASG